MGRIARTWRAWVALTSEREAPLVLACFRILIALVAVGSLLSVATSGVLDALMIQIPHGALHLEGGWLVNMLGGPTVRVMWCLWTVALIACACVAVGLGGRVACLIAAQAYLAVARVNPDVAGGYDAMINNALYLLIFSSAFETLSLDCRRKTGRWTSDVPVPAWPRYLLVFQLLVIYGSTALHKLSPVWTPVGGYSALFWVFQDPTWRRFDMSFVAGIYPLLQVATAITWHWELAMPLLLVWYGCNRSRDRGGRLRRIVLRWDLRKPFAAMGVMLHLGILMTLNVGPFSFASLAYYVLLWTPDELAAAGRTLRDRFRLPSGTYGGAADAPTSAPAPRSSGARRT
jgi:hypothetical protein